MLNLSGAYKVRHRDATEAPRPARATLTMEIIKDAKEHIFGAVLEENILGICHVCRS
jgi:hypothetical protein